MKKNIYKFWLDYRCGKINRKLTRKECREIKSGDIFMNFILPTDKLLEISGGLDNLKLMNVKELAEYFYVSEELMNIKINSLVKEELEKSSCLKKRVLKKEYKIPFSCGF